MQFQQQVIIKSLRSIQFISERVWTKTEHLRHGCVFHLHCTRKWWAWCTNGSLTRLQLNLLLLLLPCHDTWYCCLLVTQPPGQLCPTCPFNFCYTCCCC
jgi:hypothetical protein